MNVERPGIEELAQQNKEIILLNGTDVKVVLQAKRDYVLFPDLFIRNPAAYSGPLAIAPADSLAEQVRMHGAAYTPQTDETILYRSGTIHLATGTGWDFMMGDDYTTHRI